MGARASIGVFERHCGVQLASMIIFHHYEPFLTGWLWFRYIPTISMISMNSLKRSFWAHYLEEPLSVIAHWNREEQHYRMGWLEVTFNGQGSHKER
jgi:hypothetical protein